MRWRAPLLAILVALIAVAGSGCSDEPMAASTAPIADGTEVSAQRYLADVDAAAGTLREFSDALEQIPTPATPTALRSASPRLADIYARARAIVDRLDSQRLADARLEQQRAEALPVLRDLLAAMDGIFTQANRGRVALTAEAVEQFRAGLDSLAELGTP